MIRRWLSVGRLAAFAARLAFTRRLVAGLRSFAIRVARLILRLTRLRAFCTGLIHRGLLGHFDRLFELPFGASQFLSRGGETFGGRLRDVRVLARLRIAGLIAYRWLTPALRFASPTLASLRLTGLLRLTLARLRLTGLRSLSISRRLLSCLLRLTVSRLRFAGLTRLSGLRLARLLRLIRLRLIRLRFAVG
jgi:hypothetical protein